jgi:ribosomal protein L40E
MLPKMLGVDNIKLMALVGALFAVSTVLIGGFVTAPELVKGESGEPLDNEYFGDVAYTYNEGGITITATLLQDISPYDAYLVYYEVNSIGYAGLISAGMDNKKWVPLHVSGTSVDGVVVLDRNILYAGYLTIGETNDSGEEVPKEIRDPLYWTFFTGAYDKDITPLCLYGCFAAVLYVVIIYFLIMIFSNIMRKRMEKTREKMEKEGRLYPKGYGRCDKCGATVLPGEVNCRKCGAYIDRPEEMKPDKKDFFECSDCGAEVPMDAVQCPKCGAVFDDDDEFEVVHADGKVEATKDSFECPECGATVPATASFCTKCGARPGKK